MGIGVLNTMKASIDSLDFTCYINSQPRKGTTEPLIYKPSEPYKIKKITN
jgi:hypothetical protein